ncbi:hypothetical protein [Actinomadura sp. NTSP31]|uniref:hypothetical protein n=1 Tax=Actinomadura sp. NTSP31 TaxID=1735447 RepID=UPI0035C25C71
MTALRLADHGPSIARYAPVDDMALAFDGYRAFAQAVLPASLIPAGTAGGAAFSLTFWLNVQPVLEKGADPPTISGPMVVADIRGARGPLATWSIERDLTLGFAVPGSAPGALAVDLRPYLRRWVFVVSVYGPPADDHPHGQVGLLVSDGGPVRAPVTAELEITPNPAAEDRLLTVGNLPTAQYPEGLPDLGPLTGMITRMRLWTVALSSAAAAAHMYDAPIGPKGGARQSLAGDWRMNEGYGVTAFDYADPGPGTLPVRYQPPTGNHLRLGDGEPGTEPAWIIADLVTLVRKTATAEAP